MGLTRYWRPLRTVVIAVALGISALGLCHALTVTYHMGGCWVGPPPWKRLCEWLRQGRFPLSVFLDSHERNWLVSNAISVTVLGGLLAWSIRAHGSLRFRLRVRTLMIVIAVVSFVCLGGQQVWDMWERFDVYCQYAEYCSEIESTLRRGASGSSDHTDSRRRLAEEYRVEKDKFQRAAWHPWRAVDYRKSLTAPKMTDF